MNNRTDFDVIIIGAGPSGIFCAYELIKERPSLNILMVEKGRPIEKRVCPKRTTKVCVGCRPCSITTGFAGAGAFSDGKLSLSPDVGGNLPDILGYDKALELIHESDGERYYAREIVSAIGREGSDWFSHVCRDHGIETRVGTVDIGVRVEVRDEVMEFLNKNLYEAKLVYYTPTFDDKVRTFCTNPSGEVATEYYENGLAVVNGHAYKSQEYKTHNTNFALLVSKNFTKPFKTPIEYGKHVAQLSNMLCDGKILVQTFGDFLRGRRTTEERLCRNNLIPTLKDAVPGDVSLVLPHRIMVDIKEMLLALDKVTPGIASDETLLYGVEVKFYSNKVVVNKDFETSIPGLRAIGDGASVTRGLQQASANGLSVARSILERL